ADGGWTLWWNAATSPAGNDPFMYDGDGTYITSNSTVYARWRWNVTDNAIYGYYLLLSDNCHLLSSGRQTRM
ncbi:unnamed protein product, partial [marine sediment metagenome]